MSEIMQPAPGPAPAVQGGQALPPRPGNFAANMGAKNAQQSGNPQTSQLLAPQPGSRFDKPQVDGGQFEGNQQRHENPGDQRPPTAEEQQGLGNPDDPQQPPQTNEERLQQLQATLQQALQTGQMPEELLDLMVKVPWGENGHREVPARELVQGFMRQSDYTRAKTEIRNESARLQNIEQGLRGTFENFKTPETMHQQLMSLGFRKQLEGAARIIYKQWHEEEQIVRALPADKQHAYRANLERARQLEEQNASAMRRQQYLEQQAQQNTNQQAQQQNAQMIQNQINQLRPMAFKSMGIIDAPYHRQIFERELVAVVQNSGQPFNGQITRDQAWAAAQSAKEIIEDDAMNARANSQPGQQNGQGGQPMNPLRLPSGAPQSQVQRQQGQRRRPGQFGDDMRSRTGGTPRW